MHFHLLVAQFGLACAAFAQAPRELTLDEHIDALPPIGCEQHLDSHGGPSEPPELAELRRAVEARALSDEQWRRALSKSGAIRWRRRTVAGEPFLISLRRPAWLDGAELRLTPRLPDAATLRDPVHPYRCLTCDTSEHVTFWGWHHGRELGALAPRTRALVCDVEVARLGGARSPAGREPDVLWHGDWNLDVELVHSIDEVLARTQGRHVDDALRAALDVRIGDGRSGSQRIVADQVAVFVSLCAGAERNPELCDLAVSFDAELLCDDRVVASTWGVPISCGELAHPEHPASAAPPGFELRLRLGPIPAADADDPTRRARWSVRLKSNAAGALALWDAKRYWKGELDLPLGEALASYASAMREE